MSFLVFYYAMIKKLKARKSLIISRIIWKCQIFCLPLQQNLENSLKDFRITSVYLN